MILLTHRFDFCASHRLHNPALVFRFGEHVFGKETVSGKRAHELEWDRPGADAGFARMQHRSAQGGEDRLDFRIQEGHARQRREEQFGTEEGGDFRIPGVQRIASRGRPRAGCGMPNRP